MLTNEEFLQICCTSISKNTLTNVLSVFIPKSDYFTLLSSSYHVKMV